MLAYGLPVAYALFLWWFSTGVVIILDSMPPRTYAWSMTGATLILLGSLYGLSVSSADTSVVGGYTAFSCALLIWGWNEISFLMGFVSGPRRGPCPVGASGWLRFRYATETLLYHELVILGMAALIVAITANGPNQFGTWTFIILWWMRLSAKLNVFFGVPNLTEELLPDHLKYLESYFRRRPMNLFFPVSITVSTILAVWVAHRAASATTLLEGSGNIFLATLISLAILEHWFLVLPFSSVRLWSWSRRTGEPALHLQSVAAEPEESKRELGFDVLNAKASV